MTASDTSQPTDTATPRYDKHMMSALIERYYGHSDFFNYGYWDDSVTTQAEASANLVEKLVALIPDKSGTILDVACGLGATTRQLLTVYDAANVTAINLSEVQVARAQENAPGADVRVMSATELDFPDNSFDNIICVEAAFHFETRVAFLEEAHRVLKPGGTLVMSDILFNRIRKRTEGNLNLPRANQVRNLQAYRKLFSAAGFDSMALEDATKPCWLSFRKSLLSWLWAERRAGTFREKGELRRSSLVWFGYAVSMGFITDNYVLVGARKPK